MSGEAWLPASWNGIKAAVRKALHADGDDEVQTTVPMPLPTPQDGPVEVCRARQLIAAIDRGGLPLNPAIVNQIARGLGLEVSSKAAMGDTVERIRDALRRL